VLLERRKQSSLAEQVGQRAMLKTSLPRTKYQAERGEAQRPGVSNHQFIRQRHAVNLRERHLRRRVSEGKGMSTSPSLTREKKKKGALGRGKPTMHKCSRRGGKPQRTSNAYEETAASKAKWKPGEQVKGEKEGRIVGFR